jgi:hypothetical protein
MDEDSIDLMKKRETEEVKLFVLEELEYDPLNGFFRWKKPEQRKRTRLRGWFSGGKSGDYKNVSIMNSYWKAHRIAWLLQTGNWPSGEVDHKDGRKSNNVFTNLRDVPHSENAKNRKFYSVNKSGAIGVYKRKGSTLTQKPWRAAIRVGGKLKNLGSFFTIEEAAEARKFAEVEYGFHPNHGRKN